MHIVDDVDSSNMSTAHMQSNDKQQQKIMYLRFHIVGTVTPLQSSRWR